MLIYKAKSIFLSGIILICSNLLALCQDCFTIDFETIPNTEYGEGYMLSDEFKDSLGITFHFENSKLPIIAQIGPPRTAFEGVGNDIPNEVEKVGDYFLTDDGVLSGKATDPLIIEFEQPMQQVGGQIIDIDGGEYFTIELLDINKDIITSDTIFSEDPAAGNGVVTPWQLITKECKSIYSVKIWGIRDNENGFIGFAYDNFKFCYQDRIPQFVETTIDVDSCKNNGVVTISTSTDSSYQYAINSSNFQPDSIFIDVPTGSHTLFIKNSIGCVDSQKINVPSRKPYFEDIKIVHPSCNESNGKITGIGKGGSPPYNFSIDGTNFLDSSSFTALSSGQWTLHLRDSEGCRDSSKIQIGTEQSPKINKVDVTPASCGKNNGKIEVIPNSENKVEFSIDGINFTDKNTFEELPKGGYTVYIRNEFNCLDSQKLDLGYITPPSILEVTTTPTTCGRDNGSATIYETNEDSSLYYSINGSDFHQRNNFTNLRNGNYTAYIRDPYGCMTHKEFIINPSLSFNINNIDLNPSKCGKSTGSIDIDVSGGTGEITSSINDSLYQSTLSYPNLTTGNYRIKIRDEAKCQLDTTITIDQENCPIFIPNAFTPNKDGINDIFRVYTHPDFRGEVLSLKVFDKWGGLKFSGINNSKDMAWNGTSNGEILDTGTYVYVIEIEFGAGNKDIFKGEVSLIR